MLNKWKKTAKMLNRQLDIEVQKRIRAEREAEETGKALTKLIKIKAKEIFGENENG